MHPAIIAVRKPTQILRATLTQEFGVILDSEYDAPADSWRRITIITPGAGLAYLALDVSPDSLGPNRAYKAAEFAPNNTVCFVLRPEQTLVGASDDGLVYMTMIVEYLA